MLARSRPAASAFSSKANRQSVAVAVASPSRKADECAKDERISSSGKKRSASLVLPANKQSAPSVVASALSGSRGGETSSSADRASEALVAALQQPEGANALSPPPLEAGEEQSKSSSPSEIQALAARLWSAYDAALTSHPVAVKSATSFVGFLLGDLIAQSIVGLPYDARRTLRLVAFGVFMDGPIGEREFERCFSPVFGRRRRRQPVSRARQAHSDCVSGKLDR